MKAIWNGTSISNSRTLSILANNRGIQYGDGFFETFVLHEGKTLLMKYHQERLRIAAEIFGLQLPSELLDSTLADWLENLAGEIPAESVRAKLLVWREAGGLYTPQSAKAEYLLWAMPQLPREMVAYKVALSETVRLQPSAWSSCKSLNALPYVFAGREKKVRGLDEIILLSTDGFLAEAGAANLFWEDERKVWHTAPLTTGCIAGVMRAYLLNAIKEIGLEVQESKCPPDALRRAERAFVCNVSGIVTLAAFEQHDFDIRLDDIYSLIPQPGL